MIYLQVEVQKKICMLGLYVLCLNGLSMYIHISLRESLFLTTSSLPLDEFEI